MLAVTGGWPCDPFLTNKTRGDVRGGLLRELRKGFFKSMKERQKSCSSLAAARSEWIHGITPAIMPPASAEANTKCGRAERCKGPGSLVTS